MLSSIITPRPFAVVAVSQASSKALSAVNAQPSCLEFSEMLALKELTERDRSYQQFEMGPCGPGWPAGGFRMDFGIEAARVYGDDGTLTERLPCKSPGAEQVCERADHERLVS